MSVTKDQAHMLAALAAACRPHRAPRWDEPGIVAAIAKVSSLALPDVTLAVIRAASDPAAKTPGVIAATTSIHWREKASVPTTPQPPRTTEACRLCGRHLDRCTCGQQQTRPPSKATNAAQYAEQARAAIRGAKEEDR